MYRFLPLVLAGTLGACAEQPMVESGVVAPMVDDEVAPPQQSLVLTNLGNPQIGSQFGWRVSGAQPGQQVLIIVANGGLQPNGGTCASFLGGNCADILPGTLGYTVAAAGIADANGEILRGYTLPASVAPGTYQFQAFVLSNNFNGNESNATEATVTAGPGQCLDDGFEPNDSIAGAEPMPAPGTAAVMCDSDLDVYSIDVPSGGILEVSIDYDANDGDVDLDLVDMFGTLLDASGSTTNSDLVLWQNNTGADETVYARMFSLEPITSGGSAYTIDWELVAPTPCTDDAFEDDDTPGTARIVGTGQYSGQSCGGDADWYRVAVNAGDQLSATLFHDIDDGNAVVGIYGSNGNTQLTGLSDGERYTATSNGNLWVRVSLLSDSASGGGVPYELSLSIANNITCPNDVYEQNDSQGNAASISAGLISELGGCFGDDDWYAIDVDQNVDDVVYLSLLFSNDDADLDVEILNPNGQVVATGQTGSDNENISTFVNQSGTYFIHVYVWSGSSDGAPTNNGAIYDMVVYTN